MVRRTVTAVLTLLMLVPAGTCTCDGGVPGGADDPAGRHAPASVGRPGAWDGPAEGSPPAPDHTAEPPHRCPPPSNHQPSCRAVAPAAAVPTFHPSMASGFWSSPVAIGLTPEPARLASAPRRPHVPAPSLFLAHCALVI